MIIFVSLLSRLNNKETKFIEKIVSENSLTDVDDWYVNDFAQLEGFDVLISEFGIIGLNRCVEMFRKRIIGSTLGHKASCSVFNYGAYTKSLSSIGIREDLISCSRSVNELRCLNNAVKHNESAVSSELAQFWKWKSKEGNPLGNMTRDYTRLRPLVANYLKDFSLRLNRWWKRNHP